MKIIDILPAVRKDKLDYFEYKYSWENPPRTEVVCRNSVTERKMFEKKGFYFRISTHSKNKGWLLNNLDKEDVVVGYLKDRFTTLFLVKKRGDKYCGLTYVNTQKLCRYGYTFYDFEVIGLKEILQLFEEEKDITIVNNDEYERAKKKLILEKIQNGNT